jgi:type III secretion system low calcium response chaperone LcrH/SycD
MQIQATDFAAAIDEINEHSKTDKELEAYLLSISDKVLNKGIPAKDVFKIDDTVLNQLYSQAYELFKYGQYELASSIFQNLLLLNSKNSSYAYALGACFTEMKYYEKAIMAFFQSFFYNIENPQPLYDCALCCLELKEDKQAIEFLNLFIGCTKDNPKWKSLNTKAQLTLNKLTNQKA